MAINASIDGVSYNSITKILTGGKTINLSYHDDGGGGSDLPEGIAEIKMGTYSPDSDKTSSQSISHGCSGTPDIIVLYSDYKTHYTSDTKPSNTTVVVAHYDAAGGIKNYGTVATTYTGGTNTSSITGAEISSTNDGHIIDVGSSTFSIKAVSNRRIGGGLTYTWIAIRLA